MKKSRVRMPPQFFLQSQFNKKNSASVRNSVQSLQHYSVQCIPPVNYPATLTRHSLNHISGSRRLWHKKDFFCKVEFCVPIFGMQNAFISTSASSWRSLSASPFHFPRSDTATARSPGSSTKTAPSPTPSLESVTGIGRSKLALACSSSWRERRRLGLQLRCLLDQLQRNWGRGYGIEMGRWEYSEENIRIFII